MKMMSFPGGKRWTSECRAVLRQAQRLAQSRVAAAVELSDLLAALLATRASVGGQILRGVCAAEEQARLPQYCEPPRADPARPLDFSAGTMRAFKRALVLSTEMGHNYVGSEHLALAVAQEKQDASSRTLSKFGISIDALLAATRGLVGAWDGESSSPMGPRARKLLVDDFPAQFRADKELLFLLEIQNALTDEQYQQSPMVQEARCLCPRDCAELTSMLVDFYIQAVQVMADVDN